MKIFTSVSVCIQSMTVYNRVCVQVKRRDKDEEYVKVPVHVFACSFACAYV